MECVVLPRECEFGERKVGETGEDEVDPAKRRVDDPGREEGWSRSLLQSRVETCDQWPTGSITGSGAAGLTQRRDSLRGSIGTYPRWERPQTSLRVGSAGVAEA